MIFEFLIFISICISLLIYLNDGKRSCLIILNKFSTLEKKVATTLSKRSTGASITTTAHWIANVGVSFLVPILLEKS